MKLFLIAFSLFGSLTLSAQVEETTPVPPPPKLSVPTDTAMADPIFDMPDIDAQFPGGTAEMKKYIQENVQYPEYSLKHKEIGRVYVSFVVEKDGSITGIDIPRPLTPSLDAETIRLISSMPKWKPGTMDIDGKPVRTRVRLPITFTLD